ncbi:MAG: wax synthase family protein [Akkermansiaceae bacterium]
MVIWLTFLGLVGGQILLAGVLGGKFCRGGVWGMLLGALVLMHWVALDEGGFMRMVWICSVLMAGMKAITYREWCVVGGRRLPWGRWLMFSCLWFGMDPGAFVARRRVEWRSHVVVGSACLVVGLMGVWVCYLLDVRSVLLLFVFMSAGFHFGVLRLLTGFWRMMGFPVRVLFRNPLVMRGFQDFWGRRWNLAYSQMMARAVKRPLVGLLGERGSLFAVFVVSGLLHELAITVPVGGGYGWPTLFFVVHGVVCFFERGDSRVMAVVCGMMLVLGVPYLFGEKFVDDVILPSRDVMEYLTIREK